MLSEPGAIKLHKLVKACGFPSVDRLRLVFKRLTGMTPMEYRQAARAKK